MRGAVASLVFFALALLGSVAASAADRPACERPFALTLHEHGWLQTTIVEFDDPSVPHGLIMWKKAFAAARQQARRAMTQF